MLCLPEPYGSPTGVSVSIRAPNHRHADIAEVCRNWGCPPPTVERVRDSIRHSGRYDCFLGSSASGSSEAIAEDLAQYEGEIEIRETDSDDYRFWLNRKYIPTLADYHLNKDGHRLAGPPRGGRLAA